mmetsp:Transcript_10477/g.37217  ORF Transcript_10477/g.37217 Transcript_10477/m.37217 type:complete len:838 (+) Transcript_10477:280-2793(+)
MFELFRKNKMIEVLNSAVECASRFLTRVGDNKRGTPRDNSNEPESTKRRKVTALGKGSKGRRTTILSEECEHGEGEADTDLVVDLLSKYSRSKQGQTWEQVCRVEVDEDEDLNPEEIQNIVALQVQSDLVVQQSPYQRRDAWVHAFLCAHKRKDGGHCTFRARAVVLKENILIEVNGNHDTHASEFWRPMRGLTVAQKKYIDSCIHLKAPTPYQIMVGMLEANKGGGEGSLVCPQVDAAIYDKIKNYIKRMKKDKRQKLALKSLQDVETFASMQAMRDDQRYTTGCIGHEVDFKSSTFRIIFSTPNMLRAAATASHFAADATYKLNHLGWPVLVMGFLSRESPKFHLVAIALTNTETEKDLHFFFTHVKMKAAAINGHPLKVKYITSDAAPAIRNAAQASFGVSPVMCYFHVSKCVKKNGARLTGNSKQRQAALASILTDVGFLRCIPSGLTGAFEALVELFLKKWEHETAFVKYFKREWVEKTPRWSRAYLLAGAAQTNNGVERFNRSLKIMTAGRPDLGTHLTQLMQSMAAFGHNQNKDQRGVHEKVDELVIKDQDSGDARLIVSKAGINRIEALVSADLEEEVRQVGIAAPTPEPSEEELLQKEQDLAKQVLKLWQAMGKSKTKQEVCAFIAKNELGFDDVRMLMQDFRLLQSIPEPHRWCEHVVLSCTCHRFQLDGWCKHSLAEGLRLKLVTFPVQHQDLQLSRRNAPGRPKKTRPCLEVQAGEAPQSFGVPPGLGPFRVHGRALLLARSMTGRRTACPPRPYPPPAPATAVAHLPPRGVTRPDSTGLMAARETRHRGPAKRSPAPSACSARKELKVAAGSEGTRRCNRPAVG